MKKPSTPRPREAAASQTIEEAGTAATERAKKERRAVHKLPGGDGDDDNDPPERRLHLDKRAETLVAIAPEGSDDDLLSTVQIAGWLGVTAQWVELGRAKGYGPPFIRLAPQVVRYQRAAVIEWLRAREFKKISDYDTDTPHRKGKAARAAIP